MSQLCLSATVAAMPKPITPPGFDAGDYTFTKEDIAQALDTTPGQIEDAMRAHLLAYLVLPDVSGESKPRVRFRLAEAQRYQAMKERGEIPTDRANVVRVASYLRSYLTAIEPDYEYDSAVERGAPLWVSLRGGKALYITVAALIAHVERAGLGALSKTTATEALEFMRCVRKRGVVPYGEQGTPARWGTWWRIPNSLVPDADMEDDLADDAVFGLLKPGERITRSNELPRGESGAPISSVGVAYLDGRVGDDG